jgi:CheY-like chemotaxis protein
MDGLTATRQIIAALGADAPPIVAFTASVSEEEKQRCADAGCVLHIAKPVRMTQMGLLHEARAVAAVPSCQRVLTRRCSQAVLTARRKRAASSSESV